MRATSCMACVCVIAVMVFGISANQCPAFDVNSVLAERTQTFIELDGDQDRLTFSRWASDEHTPTAPLLRGLHLNLQTGATFELIVRAQHAERWDRIFNIGDAQNSGFFVGLVDDGDGNSALYTQVLQCASSNRSACKHTPMQSVNNRMQVPMQQWLWIVLTIDSSGLDLWVNGVKSALSLLFADAQVSVENAFFNVTLGGTLGGARANHGEVAFFRVYDHNARMSDTQVMQLYTDTLYLDANHGHRCITIDSSDERDGQDRGHMCEFPFEWNGHTHYKCTKDATDLDRGRTSSNGDTLPWCGTRDYESRHSWGYCNTTFCDTEKLLDEKPPSTLEGNIKYNFPIDSRDLAQEMQASQFTFFFFNDCSNISHSDYKALSECPTSNDAVGVMAPRNDDGPTWGFGNDAVAEDVGGASVEFGNGDSIRIDNITLPKGNGFTIESVFWMDKHDPWSRVFDFRNVLDPKNDTKFWKYPGFGLARNGTEGSNNNFYFMLTTSKRSLYLKADFDVLSNFHTPHHVIITGRNRTVLNLVQFDVEIWINGDRVGSTTWPADAWELLEGQTLNFNALGAAGTGTAVNNGGMSLFQFYSIPLRDKELYHLYSDGGTIGEERGRNIMYSWDFAVPGVSSKIRGGLGELQPRCIGVACKTTTTPNVRQVYGHFKGSPTWTITPTPWQPAVYVELNKQLTSDGSQQKSSINDLQPIVIPHTVTFEAVFRHATNANWARIFDIRRKPKAIDDERPSWKWDGFTLFRYDGSRNNELAFSVKTEHEWGGILPEVGTFPTTLGTWHHVVVTGSLNSLGFAVWCMWVDGRQLPCQTDHTPPANTTTYDGVAIGGVYSSYGSRQTGDFDLLRIYNTTLTDAQIASLFQHCDNTACPPADDGKTLIRFWDFHVPGDTAYGEEIVDLVTKHAAEINGSAVFTVEPRVADRLDEITKYHVTLEGGSAGLPLPEVRVGQQQHQNSLVIEIVFRRTDTSPTSCQLVNLMSADARTHVELALFPQQGLPSMRLRVVTPTATTWDMIPTNFMTTLNTWHHVIVVGRANGVWEFWIDGSLRATSTRYNEQVTIGKTRFVPIPIGTPFNVVVGGTSPSPQESKLVDRFIGDLALLAFYSKHVYGLTHGPITRRFIDPSLGVPVFTHSNSTEVVKDQYGNAMQAIQYYNFNNATLNNVRDLVNPSAPALVVGDTIAMGTVMADMELLTQTHLSLDGKGDLVDIVMEETLSCIAVGKAITIEAVFRHRDYSSWARIFDFRDLTANSGACATAKTYEQPGISLMRAQAEKSGNKLFLSVVGDGCTKEDRSATWNHNFSTVLNTWHRVIITGNSTLWELWIDGDRLSQTNPSDENWFSPTTHLCSGAIGGQPGGGSYHKGEIATVRVWPKRFTDDQVLQQFASLEGEEILEPTHSWEFTDSHGTVVSDTGSTPSNGTIRGDPVWYDAQTVLAEDEGCTLCVHANTSKVVLGWQSAYFSQNYGDVVGSCYDCNNVAQGPAQWLECGCELPAGPCGCDVTNSCLDCSGVAYGLNCSCSRLNNCRIDLIICAEDNQSFYNLKHQWSDDHFAELSTEMGKDLFLDNSVTYSDAAKEFNISFLPEDIISTTPGLGANKTQATMITMVALQNYLRGDAQADVYNEGIAGQFSISFNGSCPSRPEIIDSITPTPATTDTNTNADTNPGAIVAGVFAPLMVIVGVFVVYKLIRGRKSTSSKYSAVNNSDNDATVETATMGGDDDDDDDELLVEEVEA